MPPRTPAAVASSIYNLTGLLQSLPSSSSRPSLTKCATCLFSTTTPQLSIRKKRSKRKDQDPYRAAQVKQRKTANIALQATLQAQRQASLGDPVRSKQTPFLASLTDPNSYNSDASSTSSSAASQQHLNYLLKSSDVTKHLLHSKWLTEPIPLSELDPASASSQGVAHDPIFEQRRIELWENRHANAETALQRITSLESGSSKDRTRTNIQRCIEEFGRHNTDTFLPPKPASSVDNQPVLSEAEAQAAAELAALPKRVGKDTGSSEVQVAMLTVKINTLANNLGKKDKNNKRNLRLLVHKRQKHLKYLRRKERGGPRWQHLVEKLGINDAMWKGEISL